MNDQRHDRGDMYGNRKDFPSSTTYWGPRLTQGEVRAIRPDDIQRELIKIAHLNPVAIALLTGDVDKLDPNLHCKHVPEFRVPNRSREQGSGLTKVASLRSF